VIAEVTRRRPEGAVDQRMDIDTADQRASSFTPRPRGISTQPGLRSSQEAAGREFRRATVLRAGAPKTWGYGPERN
jgi:hypothetical protein